MKIMQKQNNLEKKWIANKGNKEKGINKSSKFFISQHWHYF